VSDNENNQTTWANDEYDRLIAAAEAETDEQQRMQIFYKAETILMEEMPIIPIYFYYSRNLVRPHVRGFYNNLQDMHPLHTLWIDRSGTTVNEYMQGAAR
jgi:ABC-type oligopeptide transport system substrate-binding subunit